MQTDEFSKFRELMAAVYSFYGKPLSDFAMDLWWSALKSYSFEQARQAMGRHTANPDNGQYPPKPADVIRFLQGGTEDRAQLAWSKVDRAVRTVGAYQSVVFDDALIHAVLMDMGGWISLGNCTEQEWPFRSNEFVKRYRAYTLRGAVDYKRVLTGIAEAQNQQNNEVIAPPVMFGITGLCEQVYLDGNDKVKLLVHVLDESKLLAKSTALRVVDTPPDNADEAIPG